MDGWVVDGTGARRSAATSRSRAAGSPTSAGSARPRRADRVIDAAGRVVCPGFVDPHSHSDFSILTNPTAQSTIRQGVTTEVVGNCGWTYAPVSAASGRSSGPAAHVRLRRADVPWSTFGEHLSFLADVGHSPNLAWFVGHNTMRSRRASRAHAEAPSRWRLMEGFVDEAMQAGALGISTGLEFNPGRAATTEELVRLNAVAGRYDGYYTSHIRNRDSGLLEAIDEFLAIVREGGTSGEISHLNVRHHTDAPERGWQRAVDTMAAAREVGLDVLADTTPFRDGLGQMAGILPPWVAADGPEAAAAKLRDPALRERLRGECDRYWRFIHKGEWERVCLQATPQYPELGGLSFRADLGAARQGPVGRATSTSSPTPARTRGDPPVGTLFTDEHLAEMIAHPLFCLGVDRLHPRRTPGRSRRSWGTRSASPGTSTTSPTTCASTERCASRRRSGR